MVIQNHNNKSKWSKLFDIIAAAHGRFNRIRQV